MKTNYLFTCLFLFTCAAFAATNVTELPPLPSDLGSYWEYGIAAITPVIIWAAKKYIPSVPGALLPVATPFVGLLLGLILNKVASANLGWVDMAKAGALAVCIREVINQNITKRFSSTAKPTTN